MTPLTCSLITVRHQYLQTGQLTMRLSSCDNTERLKARHQDAPRGAVEFRDADQLPQSCRQAPEDRRSIQSIHCQRAGWIGCSCLRAPSLVLAGRKALDHNLHFSAADVENNDVRPTELLHNNPQQRRQLVHRPTTNIGRRVY